MKFLKQVLINIPNMKDNLKAYNYRNKYQDLIKVNYR